MTIVLAVPAERFGQDLTEPDLNMEPEPDLAVLNEPVPDPTALLIVPDPLISDPDPEAAPTLLMVPDLVPLTRDPDPEAPPALLIDPLLIDDPDPDLIEPVLLVDPIGLVSTVRPLPLSLSVPMSLVPLTPVTSIFLTPP